MCWRCIELAASAWQIQGMARLIVRWACWPGWGALLALSACGGSSSSNAAPGASASDPSGTAPAGAPASSERLICPQCMHSAGGETSDFGDNTVLQVEGSAAILLP